LKFHRRYWGYSLGHKPETCFYLCSQLQLWCAGRGTKTCGLWFLVGEALNWKYTLLVKVCTIPAP